MENQEHSAYTVAEVAAIPRHVYQRVLSRITISSK